MTDDAPSDAVVVDTARSTHNSKPSERKRAEDATSPLHAVLHKITSAFSARDFSLCQTLMSEYPIESWFGFTPEHLLKMLLAIESGGVILSGPLQGIRSMIMAAAAAMDERDSTDVSVKHTDHADLGATTAAEPHDTTAAAQNALQQVTPTTPEPGADLTLSLSAEMARMFDLRLHGRPVEALQLTRRISPRMPAFQTLFTTAGGTVALFGSLQYGLTAMLAGEFQFAETKFAEAKLLPTVHTLPFLSRDAHLKSALLHACFGDPAIARVELTLADQQPRTESWIEPMLDAQTDIARALVLSHSPATAVELLSAIPTNALGEMWPFYAYALHTILERAGQPSEAVRRLEVLDQTGLARVDRQGFTGSVLPSLLAFSALSAGNLGRAREFWQRTDPNLVTSRIGEAAFALAAGDAREAAKIAIDARGLTRGMRQLELWRLSVLASSLLFQGDESGCLEVLRSALALPSGISESETLVFHDQVSDFARAHLPEWPARAAGTIGGATRISLSFGGSLTSRELEVLHALARGLTREQIARELFLSANTIKTHQQTLYRKLEVSNKYAAVLEGERRGLI